MTQRDAVSGLARRTGESGTSRQADGPAASALADDLRPYAYLWPRPDSLPAKWHDVAGSRLRAFDLPETPAELAADSRWPALFPSPMCLVTASNGTETGLEKVVGASIVNRFPYVMALSFCQLPLSARHHPRGAFTRILEEGGSVAVQFLLPGPALDRALEIIETVPEERTAERLAATGLPLRPCLTNEAAAFRDAYMVYEARLVQPSQDLEGEPIYEKPYRDIGSHRVFFLEINAIQLREDIARGESRIAWRSLPRWAPATVHGEMSHPAMEHLRQKSGYQKSYTPNYRFPSGNTVAFEADDWVDGMAVRHLPPLAADQVEVDNDRARWPCFFPSSVGIISAWAGAGQPTLMPCGSTTIVSRSPIVVAPCVSYSRINARYAPRATLDIIAESGRFACGVPFISPEVIDLITYAGNVSLLRDQDKVANSGGTVLPVGHSPILAELPVSFDCRVVDQVRLGTHVMFMGAVERIFIREDLTPQNPLEWCPWATVITDAA